MGFNRAAAVAGAGTVSCTGTTTVTGSGTNFGAVGSTARLNGTITVGGVTKTIVEIVSTTSLKTDTAFGTFTNQPYTGSKEVVQTGSDTMGTGLGLIAGFAVTNRGDQQRTFDAGGVDLTINGVLTVDCVTGQLRNNSFNNAIKVLSTGSASAELIFTGRKATANNAPFPYPGFDWLGVNGAKIMQLQGSAAFPAKLTLIDACIRYGADWITTNAGQHSVITTEGDICWILNGHGSGTGQARLRLDNNTPSINFKAKKTYVGVWLNFGSPQNSLKGYTPLNTDGPEINVASVSVAELIPIEDYDSTYVVANYYAGAKITLYGGAYVTLPNNEKGTNTPWYSQNASFGAQNVLLVPKKIKAISKDVLGNILNDGYLSYQPVGTNVAGVRPKGHTTDLNFDLTQKNVQILGGFAESLFIYAWSYAATSGLKSNYNYFCSGTTPEAETHDCILYRAGFSKEIITMKLNGNGVFEAIGNHSDMPTSTKDIAVLGAITGVTFNFTTLVMNIADDAVLDYQEMYDHFQYKLNLPENAFVADSCLVANGKTNYQLWTINVGDGATLKAGGNFTMLEAKTVNLIGTGKIEGLYADELGSRVFVSGLDPENFGVTWHLRYKKSSQTTWTNVSGTGNSTTILMQKDVYDVMVRVPAYDWKTKTIDTDVSLSLEINLAYHVSANNTPQYTMSFDEDLEAAINFDYATNSVSIANTTGAIINPGFAEFYRATQRIQHIPALVWIWENPVTANATSQKILIPTGNAISFFLTEDSNASVKATCPVIHASTGLSADDRVKGNTSGYSIILGSPATAESAGLQSAIVSDILAKLGGAGYSIENDNLQKINEKVQSLDNYDDTNLIEVIGTPLQAEDYIAPDNTSIEQIFSKVETLENTDLTGIATTENVSDSKTEILTAIIEIPTTDVSALALETSVQSVKSKVDGLENYNDATLQGKVDAVKTKVDQLENTDISALATENNILYLSNQIGTPLQQGNYIAPDNDGITSIKAKVEVLENFDSSALVDKVDAITPKLVKMNEGLQLISNFEPYDEEL